MQDRLDVGGVIRRVFDIYVEQASVLMPAAAVVFVFTGIVSVLLVSGGLAVVALLVYAVATTLFTGMVVQLVADVQDGRRDATARELLNAATPVLGKLILVGVVAAVVVAIGFLLLIVPGLILLTIWSVAAPVVVLERPQGLAALGRSRDLVRGNGWQVFAVIFVLGILVTIGASALELGAESAGTGVGLVVRVVVGVLTAPLSALAAAVLYFELRGIGRRAATGPDAAPAAPTDAAPSDAAQADARQADAPPTDPAASGAGEGEGPDARDAADAGGGAAAPARGTTGLEPAPGEEGADPFGRS